MTILITQAKILPEIGADERDLSEIFDDLIDQSIREIEETDPNINIIKD